MTGSFDSQNITFGTAALTNAGSGDIFIAKYDSGGNAQWARSIGGNESDIGICVSTDAIGNVFIAGYFSSNTITFGTTVLNNSDFIGTDIFIAKYDALGNLLWARSAGGTSFDYGKSISIDVNGNVLLTGNFYSDTITFGTTVLTNSSAGSFHIFIVKYDTNGNLLWANSEGDIGDVYCISACTETSGNVLITGWFNSPTFTIGTDTLTNAGTVNIFIIKYDANGNVLWGNSTGGTNVDYGNSIFVDVNQNVYIAGYFSSPAITFGTTTLINAGIENIFLAKLDTSTITGIAELNNISTLSIAPNPFTLQTTINFNAEQKNTTIKIMDVLGNDIKTIIFSGKQVVIEKETMKPGIYFVQSIDENKNVANKKIIIQ